MAEKAITGLKALLGGALDAAELGRPDLLKRVVDGIVKLRRHGARGWEVLPAEVVVHIGVAEGSLKVLERFVRDPAFDREVEAELRNRLVRVREGALPVRRYVVQPAARTGVKVTESEPKGFRLRVEGGDRNGQVLPVPPERRELLVGRGPWHGDDSQVANDVVVTEDERSVSRKAARLHRSGAHFELQALDQREALIVARPDGQRLRPALAASGRVPVRPGDVIEFTDGRTKSVLRLHLEETMDGEPGGTPASQEAPPGPASEAAGPLPRRAKD
ncbi:MAG TPA: FHA domain-containing protein [Vicinamibacteria bacterium]|jgi:hypothetical protein